MRPPLLPLGPALLLCGVVAACEPDASTAPEEVVASVHIDPAPVVLGLGTRITLGAEARSGEDAVLPARTAAWSSSDPAIVSVDAATGVATAVAPGEATVTATIEGVAGSSKVVVIHPSSTLSAGDYHTCAVAAGGATYCWGNLSYWSLGTARAPARVQSPVGFASLAATYLGNCGLSGGGAAYCWGYNNAGQLGDGSSGGESASPVPVLGGKEFRSISGMVQHVCALDAAGRAHCWGANGDGQLGSGARSSFSAVPVPVSGDLVFTSITAGASHSCGITAGALAYCWGRNRSGELGDVTFDTRLTPVPVAGGLKFAALSAGDSFTCGITVSGSLYCWGRNERGQLGNGTITRAFSPVAVSTPHPYVAIDAGRTHACAIALGGTPFCWGANAAGELGMGSGSSYQAVPHPVSGSLSFSAIALGMEHSCGLTSDGAAVCWGRSAEGQGGRPGTANAAVPTLVAGGIEFETP